MQTKPKTLDPTSLARLKKQRELYVKGLREAMMNVDQSGWTAKYLHAEYEVMTENHDYMSEITAETDRAKA